MFIKIWQLIILYIDRMDWRAGHLTTTEGTGSRAFANKNCPRGRAFELFFQMPWVCSGVCPGGMLTAGIDSHISKEKNFIDIHKIHKHLFNAIIFILEKETQK